MQRCTSMLGALASLLVLAGCGSGGGDTKDLRAARALAPAVVADASAIAQANNQFACDLYAQLGSTGGNLFFSPFSIATALAMLDAGAAGQTDTEIRQALHFALPGEQLHPAYGALLTSLEIGRSSGVYTLATADRLFGQQGFPFSPAFVAITKDDYHAEIMPVDFAGDCETARVTINKWVSSQTDAKIPELFASGIIDDLTRLVLVNAILFKGSWEAQFQPAATVTAPFHRADGSTVQAPLMNKQDQIAIATIPGGQLGIFPYKGHDLSLIVLLPDAADGLPALESQLTGALLSQWIAAAAPAADVQVTLPRFGVSSSFGLNGVLQALGIVSAFDPEQADLAGIDGVRDLYVQAAVHKAVVTVDEEGAEAAAATGVVVGTRDAAPPFLRADHPFLFLIYDEVTQSILFMGRLEDPTA